MIESCTSSGVERKTAIYAPETARTRRFLLRRMNASSSAGRTASATDTTASRSVYPSACKKYTPYFGRKEKLINDAGDIPTKRLLHRVARSMGEISFQK